MKMALILFTVSALAAQEWRVSASPAAAGEETCVAVWLESPPGRQPAALQVEIELPARAFAVKGAPVAGDAAAQAGKSAYCNGSWKKAGQSYVYRCILAGGTRPIPDGAVLVVRGRIAPGVKKGNHPVRIGRGLAIDAQAKGSVLLKPAAAMLTVNK